MRASPGGDNVVVVFVSDHGEQIRERGAIGHTWGVYDEEVRVPFWIDAPAGRSTPDARGEAAGAPDVPLTQLDVLPTILDLMGIWDVPRAGGHLHGRCRAKACFAAGRPDSPVVLTNCTSIFACAFKNWGAMRGSRKLVATQNDARWRCFDVEQDPQESLDLGAEACGDLRALAEADGRGTPF